MTIKPFWIAPLLLDLSVEASPANTRCSVTERQTFLTGSVKILLETQKTFQFIFVIAMSGSLWLW